MPQTLGKQKLLGIGPNSEQIQLLAQQLGDRFEVFNSATLMSGIESLAHGDVSGLILLGDQLSSTGQLLQAGGLLEHLPSGIALLGERREVLWHNSRFKLLAGGGTESLIGRTLYQCFGSVEILGPDFCPLNTAYATGESARSTLRVGDKSYFEVEATPVFDGSMEVLHFLAVVVRDTSAEVLQRQKIGAIYQAGLELSDLTPQELLEMSVEDRVELLRSKILHFTKDLLEYNTVEVRVLNRSNNTLESLLAVGMNEDAEQRVLYADPKGNGVTGFVASTGKSYLCEDTLTDPLYIEGATGARSSMTVPLKYHDEVVGTLNVESPRVSGFGAEDLQFTELFSKEIATALHTLDLLNAQQSCTANQSLDLINREIAIPVDDVLASAAVLLQKIGTQDDEAAALLRRILMGARKVKDSIRKVGRDLNADQLPNSDHQMPLSGTRVLVVEAEERIRRSAHLLLGQLGAGVETVATATEGIALMACIPFDAVLLDNKPSDMGGYDAYRRLKAARPSVKISMTTGFGYDSAHAIVKARADGMQYVLFKPFRQDQIVKAVLETTPSVLPVVNGKLA